MIRSSKKAAKITVSRMVPQSDHARELYHRWPQSSSASRFTAGAFAWKEGDK